MSTNPQHKAPALVDPETAEELGISTAEAAELISTGELRLVDHAGKSYLLGSDVERILRERDPAYLAKLAAGEVDDDDPDSPTNLVGNLPRL